MTTITAVQTDVNLQAWIAVSVPFAWGFADSSQGKTMFTGYSCFVGSDLTEYLRGWNAGLAGRVEAVFGWKDAAAVDASERRQAILAAARSARDYITAKTAMDTALMYDQELYTSLPMAYRAERFASNRA